MSIAPDFSAYTKEEIRIQAIDSQIRELGGTVPGDKKGKGSARTRGPNRSVEQRETLNREVLAYVTKHPMATVAMVTEALPSAAGNKAWVSAALNEFCKIGSLIKVSDPKHSGKGKPAMLFSLKASKADVAPTVRKPTKK